MTNHSDLSRLVRDIAGNNVAMVKLGMQSVEDRMRPAIRCLEQEFFASLVDPETKMKSSLQAAIMYVLSMLPSPITDRVNEYANAKIKSDQLARHEGRADQDMTTHGTRLRAGM